MTQGMNMFSNNVVLDSRWYSIPDGILISPQKSLFPSGKGDGLVAIKAEVMKAKIFLTDNEAEFRIEVAESKFPVMDKEKAKEFQKAYDPWSFIDYIKGSDNTVNYYPRMSADWIDRMSAQYLLNGAISSHSSYHSLNLRTLSMFLYSDPTPNPDYVQELENVKNRFVKFHSCPLPVVRRIAESRSGHLFKRFMEFVEQTTDVSGQELQHLVDNAHVIYRG